MSRAPGGLWSCASGSTQPSAETPVRITSIGCAAAGSASSAVPHRARQAAQRLQLGLVGGELGAVGRRAVHEQMRDLLELAASRRRRGCRSRGSADRCRCGRRVQSAVLPATTPDSATDFFGAGCIVGRSSSPPQAHACACVCERRRSLPASRRCRGRAAGPAARLDSEVRPDKLIRLQHSAAARRRRGSGPARRARRRLRRASGTWRCSRGRSNGRAPSGWASATAISSLDDRPSLSVTTTRPPKAFSLRIVAVIAPVHSGSSTVRILRQAPPSRGAPRVRARRTVS